MPLYLILGKRKAAHSPTSWRAQGCQRDKACHPSQQLLYHVRPSRGLGISYSPRMQWVGRKKSFIFEKHSKNSQPLTPFDETRLLGASAVPATAVGEIISSSTQTNLPYEIVPSHPTRVGPSTSGQHWREGARRKRWTAGAGLWASTSE